MTKKGKQQEKEWGEKTCRRRKIGKRNRQVLEAQCK